VSIQSDISELIFATRGVSNVIADYQRMENAAAHLQRLQEKAFAAPAGPRGDAAQEALRAALRQAEQQGLQRAAQAASYAVSASISLIRTEIAWIEKAVEAYANYGQTIQTIASLSGASLATSEKFANTAKVVGMSSQQSIREVMRLSKDMESAQGRGALSKLGVNAAGKDSLEVFTEATQKLSLMHDGARKTALEMQLFGGKLALSLQPFLHQSADIIAKTNELSAHIDGRAVAAINHFQQSSMLLGQTVLVDLVFPLAGKLLPIIDALITALQFIISVVHKVDEALHGAATWAIIFTGVALAAGSVAVSIAKITEVMKALQVVEKAEIVIQAVLDALKGPAGWVALGAAAAVGGAAYYSSQQMGGSNDANATGGDMKQAANSFQDSVKDFGAAVGNFKSWSGIGGNETPSGLSATDYAFLVMQGAQGAIG